MKFLEVGTNDKHKYELTGNEVYLNGKLLMTDAIIKQKYIDTIGNCLVIYGFNKTMIVAPHPKQKYEGMIARMFKLDGKGAK